MNPKEPPDILIYDEDGEEVAVKAKWEVCSRCNGNGSIVNPNVDGHGLTRDDFAEDPQFEEDYFAGVYDIDCPECNGLRVVAVVDEISNSQDLVKLYHKRMKDEADYRSLCRFERLMGC